MILVPVSGDDFDGQVPHFLENRFSRYQLESVTYLPHQEEPETAIAIIYDDIEGTVPRNKVP